MRQAKCKDKERQLREELEETLMAYISLFEEKHDLDLQYIINDDIMGLLDFGDVYFFNTTDVVYDIDHDLPKGLILQWAEDSVDDSKNPTRQTINLHSYAKGMRFENLQKNERLIDYKQKVLRLKNGEM